MQTTCMGPTRYGPLARTAPLASKSTKLSTIPPFFQKQLKKEIGFPNETDAYRICGCFRRRDHGDSNGSGSHHNLYHNRFLNG